MASKTTFSSVQLNCDDETSAILEHSNQNHHDLNSLSSVRPIGYGNGTNYSLQCRADKVRFAAIADWGVPHDTPVTKAIANALFEKRQQLDFVIAAGDNFYGDGVASVDDPQWTTTWLQRFNVVESQLLWVAALGNHDHVLNPQAQIDYTFAQQPGSRFWFMPSHYYAIDLFVNGTGGDDPADHKHNAMRLVVLDSEAMNTSQLAWMEQQLEDAADAPKFVVAHHHIMSHGKYGDHYDLVEYPRKLVDFRKKFAQYGVKNFLGGHQHDMQYLVYDDINYWIVGGGGGHLHTQALFQPRARSATKVFRRVQHGLGIYEIDLVSREMQVTFELFDLNGNPDGQHQFMTKV